jgi:hypothetical protein
MLLTKSPSGSDEQASLDIDGIFYPLSSLAYSLPMRLTGAGNRQAGCNQLPVMASGWLANGEGQREGQRLRRPHGMHWLTD